MVGLRDAFIFPTNVSSLLGTLKFNAENFWTENSFNPIVTELSSPAGSGMEHGNLIADFIQAY